MRSSRGCQGISCGLGEALSHLLAVIVASVQGRQAEVLGGQVEDVEAALGAGRSGVKGKVGC